MTRGEVFSNVVRSEFFSKKARLERERDALEWRQKLCYERYRAALVDVCGENLLTQMLKHPVQDFPSHIQEAYQAYRTAARALTYVEDAIDRMEVAPSELAGGGCEPSSGLWNRLKLLNAE